MRDDTRVRQVARKHAGSLEASTTVSFARQIRHAQATGELEAAASVRRLAVSYLNRALLDQAGPRFPAERELRTLAEAFDALMSGQIMTAMDIIGQRFRAIEASILEEGGWSVARHLDVVPETRVDYTGEEIKLPEVKTWARIAPALPPADRTARVRAIDLAEGPLRELTPARPNEGTAAAHGMAPTSAAGQSLGRFR